MVYFVLEYKVHDKRCFTFQIHTSVRWRARTRTYLQERQSGTGQKLDESAQQWSRAQGKVCSFFSLAHARNFFLNVVFSDVRSVSIFWDSTLNWSCWTCCHYKTYNMYCPSILHRPSSKGPRWRANVTAFPEAAASSLAGNSLRRFAKLVSCDLTILRIQIRQKS